MFLVLFLSDFPDSLQLSGAAFFVLALIVASVSALIVGFVCLLLYYNFPSFPFIAFIASPLWGAGGQRGRGPLQRQYYYLKCRYFLSGGGIRSPPYSYL